MGGFFFDKLAINPNLKKIGPVGCGGGSWWNGGEGGNWQAIFFTKNPNLICLGDGRGWGMGE